MSKGFTLIELIIVIIILGILSIVAAPRFIDLSSDAKKAQIKALAATIKTTSDYVFLACQITPGCMGTSYGDTLVLTGFNQPVRVLNGYPDAGQLARNDEIDDLFDSGNFVVTTISGNTLRWSLENSTDCYVQYIQNGGQANSRPQITTVDTGC